MTDTFIRLRPIGSGYTLVPTERDDAPMFTCRVYLGGFSTDDAFTTTVSVEDYFAFIAGMTFGVEDSISQVSMEENFGSWALTWVVTDSLAPDSSAYIDILFVSKGLCTRVEMEDIATP